LIEWNGHGNPPWDLGGTVATGPVLAAFASRGKSRYVWRGHESALSDGNATARADACPGEWEPGSRRKCDQTHDNHAFPASAERDRLRQTVSPNAAET
jgi:hypothetical protein